MNMSIYIGTYVFYVYVILFLLVDVVTIDDDNITLFRGPTPHLYCCYKYNDYFLLFLLMFQTIASIKF